MRIAATLSLVSTSGVMAQNWLTNSALRAAAEAGKANEVRHLLAQEGPEGYMSQSCAGFIAWEMCATIFGSGIDENIVLEEDIGWPMLFVEKYDIDYEEKSATVSCTEGSTETQLEPMVECLISNQCIGFYDLETPVEDREGLGVCLLQNECLQFDDEGNLDVGTITNCLQRIPILNPNPPCGDFLDTIGALSCVAGCGDDTLCTIGCLVESGTFTPGVEKFFQCTTEGGACATGSMGGVTEILQCVANVEDPADDLKSVANCLVKFDPTPFKAIYREGIGCTLVDGMTEEELRAQELGNVNNPPARDDSLPWPLGNTFDPIIDGSAVDMECIQRVADEQFADEDANARAITVVHRGSLIFEQYADSVNKDSPLLGWSATKSLAGAFIGISQETGNWSVFDKAPVPEWNVDKNDPRGEITTDEMLRMSSGTRWTATALNADPTGDVFATMGCIYANDGDCAGYAASLPLIHEPNTFFDYNSGSSYLLSRIALENRGEPELGLTNFEWIKNKLFWKIGAHSAYIEFTSNQIFLGGAYGYMTARDWARMGLLFLNKGVWVDGTQVLPEGWIDYTFETGIPNVNYGAQIWVRDLNVYQKPVYAMSGFRNQNVYISPTDDIVVTRNAMPNLLYFGWNETEFLLPIYNCFA